MSVLRNTVIIVVFCLILSYLFELIGNTTIVSKKSSPDFVYPSNYKLRCYGRVYFLKRNGKIDSTYLIYFNYTNDTMKMNISYYGIYLRKEFKTNTPYLLVNVLLSSIRYEKNLSYILSGNEDWYSVRFYYKNNKRLFEPLLSLLKTLYPTKFKFLINNYRVSNDSYVFMNVKHHYPRHVELYLSFKNNSSLFYMDAKCFFVWGPFMNEDI